MPTAATNRPAGIFWLPSRDQNTIIGWFRSSRDWDLVQRRLNDPIWGPYRRLWEMSLGRRVRFLCKVSALAQATLDEGFGLVCLWKENL